MYVVMSLKALASDVLLEMNQAPKLSMYKNKLSNQHQERKKEKKKEKENILKKLILIIILIFFLATSVNLNCVSQRGFTHFSVKGSILW